MNRTFCSKQNPGIIMDSKSFIKKHVFYQLFNVLCHNIKSNENIKMAVVYKNSALQFIVTYLMATLLPPYLLMPFLVRSGNAGIALFYLSLISEEKWCALLKLMVKIISSENAQFKSKSYPNWFITSSELTINKSHCSEVLNYCYINTSLDSNEN